MTKKLLVSLILGALILSGCFGFQTNTHSVIGSGHTASETRSVTGFTAISLVGSADVQVAFGTDESVKVEAEDNLLPLIETVVQNHELMIRNKSNTSITPTQPIRISVTLKSLDGVTISGSGNITAPGLTGDALKVTLPGSGTVTLNGSVNQVNIVLAGSGNIYCGGLKAKTAKVLLNGSGNITVYANESLDAAINGSGSIRYGGSPAKLYQKVTGSGTIQEQG